MNKLENKAWKTEWTLAWKNKFIQEKSLKVAIGQFMVTLNEAEEVCYEQLYEKTATRKTVPGEAGIDFMASCHSVQDQCMDY